MNDRSTKARRTALRFAVAAAASLLLGAALFAGSAAAQGRGGGFRSSAGIVGGAGSRPGRSMRIVGRGHRRNFGGGFYPGYYSDDSDGGPDYDSGYDVAPDEPPIRLAVARPAPAPAPIASPGMVLEEHDGQWVRISGDDQVPASPDAKASDDEAAKAPAKLPAAVLVFRDGHREEVTRYTIQGDSLYVGADYWSTGSWNRKIPLSALDVPASLKASAERGAGFRLPSAANEIVVRF